MAAVTVVPGFAVRTFVIPAVEALTAAGHDVDLLPAPGWRGVPDTLDTYGSWLAERLRHRPSPVDLLVGLSAGSQAAAVTAARVSVGHLLLVSPTVSPERRTRGRLLAGWLRGDRHPDSPSLGQQVPDWSRAGLRRIYRLLVSSLDVPLEEVLPGVAAPVTIVHAGRDNLTSFAWVTALAAEHRAVAAGHRARVVELPAAPHSWPIGDEQGFVGVVEDLLAGGTGLSRRR